MCLLVVGDVDPAHLREALASSFALEPRHPAQNKAPSSTTEGTQDETAESHHQIVGSRDQTTESRDQTTGPRDQTTGSRDQTTGSRDQTKQDLVTAPVDKVRASRHRKIAGGLSGVAFPWISLSHDFGRRPTPMLLVVRHEQITQFSLSINEKVPQEKVRVSTRRELRDQVIDAVLATALDFRFRSDKQTCTIFLELRSVSHVGCGRIIIVLYHGARIQSQHRMMTVFVDRRSMQQQNASPDFTEIYWELDMSAPERLLAQTTPTPKSYLTRSGKMT